MYSILQEEEEEKRTEKKTKSAMKHTYLFSPRRDDLICTSNYYSQRNHEEQCP